MSIWLSFRDVEYVSVVAQLGSVTQAAQQLHITQPALSIYLSKLESRLGTPLFNRVGKKILPSYAGECILRSGGEILRIRDELQDEIDDIIKGECGRLRIGIPPVRGTTFLPPVLQQYRKKHPNVEIVIEESDPGELHRKLCQGELNLAFYSYVSDDPTIECQEIISDPIVLYVPPEFHLIQHAVKRDGFSYPWLDFNLCRDERFIVNYPSQRTYEISNRIFGDYEFTPTIAMQIQNQLTAIHLAGAGIGLYLAPAYFSFNISFPQENSPVILSVGRQNPYMMPFIAAWRKGLYPSKLAMEFVETAKQVYSY